MATDIKDILQNVKDIYMTDSSLNTLLNFERVIDELGLYAFANWQKGELNTKNTLLPAHSCGPTK